MRVRAIILGTCVLSLVAMCLPSARVRSVSHTGADSLAVVNVNVVPMTMPAVRPAQTVLIRDHRIATIDGVGRVTIPPGATRIDGRGKYLIPGLIDAHVHLQQDDAENDSMLKAFVANGVTTVVSLGGTPVHLRLREAVARGAILGPAILTAGPPLGDPVGQPPTTSPDAIQQAVVTQRREGYDFIKLTGDLTREAYHRLVATSREQGITLIGHAPRNLGLAPMLDERQPAVAHVEEYLYAYFFYRRPQQHPIPDLDTKLQTLAAATAEAGTTVITTLVVYRGIADQIDRLDEVLGRPEVSCVPRGIGERWGWFPPHNTYVRRFGRDTVPLFRANYQLLAQTTRAFARAHVRLLAGTDTPTAVVVPGFSLHAELRAIAAAGLAPYDTLRSATVDAAAFLNTRDRGTLEPGKRADAILLDANPLDDIGNTSRVAGVLLNGRWFSRADLEPLLHTIASTCHPAHGDGVRVTRP